MLRFACRSLVPLATLLFVLAGDTPISSFFVSPAHHALLAADDWKSSQVPDVWKNAPGQGYFWYRCWVDLPADWRERKIELFQETADDAREIFVNGRSVGRAGAFPPQYRSGLGESESFPVAPDVWRLGEPNVIAIRLYQDTDRRTNFNVAAPVIFAGEQAIRLAGAWQLRAGDELAWATAKDVQSPPAAHRFNRIERADEVRRTLKKLSGEEGPLSPAEALSRFRVPDDLEVDLVLSDPVIGQPLSMSWDERGRMWVVEFRQYPNPAGLKMVSRDKFLRSIYDRVPPAPPNHFRGEDRITIHEDTDGDGRYDRHKTFVDGLSLVSSCAVGRGGVWVLNPPYLLFYPDRNGDDLPDGDPEVHLEGFGIEDSHSIANSLRWGPDGWLYAAQGSTVSADVRRPGDKSAPVHSMGQLIWRYHPTTRRYEIFAEGGGNTFGVEIDDQGRIFSGHNGGDTRGFHYVQGGYFQKGFGKHGSLSNPYSFGYFPEMAHHSVPRFTHTFVIYEGTALPASYRGKLFGVEPLQGRVVMSDVQRDRSSFKTKDLGHVLTTTDTWFRPVDIKSGPDDAIYVADLYEQRIDHASHYQGRVDKSTGRIYRLRAKGSRPAAFKSLAAGDPAAVMAALQSDNRWRRQTAQRLLGDLQASGQSQGIAKSLAESLARQTGQVALETLWALNAVDGLTEPVALQALDHSDPFVRLWTIRLLGDQQRISSPVRDKLVDLAYRESHVEVRSQLASSARRLPAADSLPIVAKLLTRAEDAGDIHVPLLLWWALEAKAESDRNAVVAIFREPDLWKSSLVSTHIAQRLMRRYATPGTRQDLLTCAELLGLAPTAENKKQLMNGFEEAYQGRSLAGLPGELVQAMTRAGGASLPLRVRQGDAAAIDEALQLLTAEKTDAKQRRQLIELFGQLQQPRALEPLLKLLQHKLDVPAANDTKTNEGKQHEAQRATVLAALQSFDSPQVATVILQSYPQLSTDNQALAISVLASRPTWTRELLSRVEGQTLAAKSIPITSVKKLLLRSDEEVTQRVQKIWGDVQGATTAQMREAIDKLVEAVLQGSGNPYNGKQLYVASCGKCHRLFDDGGRIGPDLTSYKRDDLRRMLLNVVNPSAEIREGFENYVIQTSDGRTINGFLVDQDPQIVTLRGVDGQTTIIPRDEIEELKAVAVSLMPEGLLKELSEQQVRDLFAYLRATQPLP
ncbi:MAG: PVC-type heme-binding CxxCH protein [Planctomycetota bacterium]